MTKTMTKHTTTGSKKAAEPNVVNVELSPKAVKHTNFDLVAVGICPHDKERLGEEVRGRGVGVTRTCEACGHTWYINKKIRTFKCLTCSGSKRNTTERAITNRKG